MSTFFQQPLSNPRIQRLFRYLAVRLWWFVPGQRTLPFLLLAIGLFAPLNRSRLPAIAFVEPGHNRVWSAQEPPACCYRPPPLGLFAMGRAIALSARLNRSGSATAIC